MELSPDELAGIADTFGALTRDEIITAVGDIAARAGEPHEAESIDNAIDNAIEAYYLVTLDPAAALSGAEDKMPDEPLLLPGPAALPELPDGGEDLPYLVDVKTRVIDREAGANAMESRLRADAAATIDEGDVDRAALLLDVCYEVEAWGPVELDDTKAGLADLLE